MPDKRSTRRRDADAFHYASPVVSIGGAPLFAGLANLLRGRRIARHWAWSTSAATVGMALVVLPGSHDASSRLGVLFAAGAAATYALQAHYIEALGQRHRPTEVVAVLSSASAVILAPAAAPLLPLLSNEPAAAGGIVYLGLFTTSIAYWLFASGVRHVGAPVAVTLSLIEPVAATVLGAVVAHEVPGLLQIVGVTITVTALAVLSARLASTPTARSEAAQ